jgi:hypothetical protein
VSLLITEVKLQWAWSVTVCLLSQLWFKGSMPQLMMANTI